MDKEKLIAEIEAGKEFLGDDDCAPYVFREGVEFGLNKAIDIIRKHTPQPDANAELVEALEEILDTAKGVPQVNSGWIIATIEQALAKHKAGETDRQLNRLELSDVEALIGAYDFAKELNRPLTAIQGNIDIVRELLTNSKAAKVSNSTGLEATPAHTRGELCEIVRLSLHGYAGFVENYASKTAVDALISAGVLRVSDNPKQREDMKKKCKGCSKDISKKHPNAKFCTTRCKDTYWNMVNPRGKFEHLNKSSPIYEGVDHNYDPSWDSHKEWTVGY
jgi:hypothetical protein